MNKQWYIVTNTENLHHFFNYCLIFDKQGFNSNSYLIDAMDDVPKGYIPCFSKESLTYALKKSIEEDSNLRSCILEIDIKQFKDFNTYGACLANANTGEISNQKASDISKLFQDENINCVLLPAPLSFNIIAKIFLPDAKVKTAVKKIYDGQFKETIKRDFFKVNKTLFKLKEKDDEQLSLNEPSEKWKVENKIINYNKVFAYGGSLGLMYYQTKNGFGSTEAFYRFRNIENQDNLKKEAVELEYLAPFLDYFYGNNVEKNHINEIYKQLLDGLILAKSHGESKYIISKFLKEIETPQNYITKCTNLSTSLERLNENIVDKDPETIFKIILKERYEDDISFRNFALLMTLFFLRGHTETALKYYHPDFKEEHYVLAALIFGAIYGVVNIPNDIRQFYGLSTWLSYKMAQFAYVISGNTLKTQKAPSEPLSIYGDIIKLSTTSVRRLHDLYGWIDKKYNNKELSLIESIQALPKSGQINDHKIVSYGLPDIEVNLNMERLGNCIQDKIKEDELFDMNAIFDAYKKYTK